MIAICEKDRVYLAISIAKYRKDDYISLAPFDIVKPDNLPIWKVEGKKNTLMAGYVECPAVDQVRYAEKLFKREINTETLRGHTIERLREIGESMVGLSKEGDILGRYIVACKDRAYKIARGVALEIEDVFVDCSDADYIEASLEKNASLDIEKRLLALSEDYEAYTGSRLAPFAVMDTKTEKIRIINN